MTFHLTPKQWSLMAKFKDSNGDWRELGHALCELDNRTLISLVKRGYIAKYHGELSITDLGFAHMEYFESADVSRKHVGDPSKTLSDLLRVGTILRRKAVK